MAGPEQSAQKPQAPSRLVPGSEHSRKHTCPPAPIPVLPAAWPPSPTSSSVMAHRHEVLLQLKGRDNEHFISHFILTTTPEVGAVRCILPMLKTFRALPDATWLVSGRARIQPKVVWLMHPLNNLLKAPTNARTSVRFTLYACAGQLVLRSGVYSLEWESKAEPRALDTAFKCPQKAGLSQSVCPP